MTFGGKEKYKMGRRSREWERERVRARERERERERETKRVDEKKSALRWQTIRRSTLLN